MRPPGGNITFLFTDIERSSQLWELHPQTMGRALAQHDDLVRAALAGNNGYVFKTVGDAFCVAFASAADAVRASVSTQRALAAAVWEETGPLRVRIALHSGEAEERNGDYFGQTLNRVARVLAAGHGGQTLLSRVTAERVRELLPDGVSLRDLGERRLKDLSRPEHIFQLLAPGLPAEFPPLRSLEMLPNNLPAQVTSFIGRAREMAEVKRLLGTTRLLTLTGPGGTGKTRLSLQAAAEVLERFPHGVWLVELATLSDPALVPETIASAVDIRGEHGRAPLETLVHALRARRLLLVLDNCEHLIAACAQIAATLLRSCPEVSILASSREALNIEGETIQPIAPLTVFEFGRQESELPASQLAELEAVQLFAERAAAVRPGFTLTKENGPLVAKICWRLDGIPLAIELAAARVKVLTLQQILDQLDNRFRLLSGGSRVAQTRQRTLGALIDWSYDLLSEPERILLRRLTVFVASRTVEMVEEVCAGEGLEKDRMLELLSALVEKSLLTVEPGPDGENFYTMLESVWDYGEEKLAQHQETERYRRRHLEYFTRFSETAEPELIGANQKSWLGKLSAEHHNLNMALRCATANPDTAEQGLRLAGALCRYWEVRSYLTEGYAHYQTLLATAGDTSAPAVRAKAELGAGRLSWCQSRNADALRHYRAAQALYQSLGDVTSTAYIEVLLGFAERDEGNAETARAHFQRALSMAKEVRLERVVASALNGIGSLAADQGDFAIARESKERSLVTYRSLGDQYILALITGSLGRVCFLAGDHDGARKFLREFLMLARDLGNKWTIPYAIEGLADICATEKQGRKAVQLYGAAKAQRDALNLAFSVTELAAHEKALAGMRELISADAFDEEWNNGQAMNLQAAIELAVEDETSRRRTRPKRPIASSS